VPKRQRGARKKWTARVARSDGANEARCANCDACVPAGPSESGYSAAGSRSTLGIAPSAATDGARQTRHDYMSVP
jgi:hypothetical protein